MKDPKFSVIIPTYNRGYMIMATLESLFSQSFKHFEIIVVDNCSTDNTEEVLRPLIEKGAIKFIKHDKNYERAKSRNTGMNVAQGEFVTFLDSDDFLYKNCLKDAESFIKRNSDIKIFHNLYELVNSDKETVKTYSFPPIKNAQKEILMGNFLSCIGIFIHKDIYENYRFDLAPELIGSEDHEYWIRIIADYSIIGRINKVNAGILEHPDRTVNQLDITKSINRKKYILEKLRTDKQLTLKYSKWIKHFEAYINVFAASDSNSIGTYRKSCVFLYNAIRIDLNSASTIFFKKVLGITILKILKLK